LYEVISLTSSILLRRTDAMMFRTPCFRKLLVAIFVLSMCILGSSALMAADNPPLKIGILVPYSKVYAVLGESITYGAELYFDQVGWQAGGRKIELIKEDSEANPPTGLRKARKLIENDKVDATIGIVSTAVLYAVRDLMHDSKSILMVATAGGIDLSRTKRSPYIFRAAYSNWQLNFPMGKWYYDNIGKEVFLIAPDYAAGKEHLDSFKESYLKAGGKVIAEVFPPLGNNDFGPYLSQIAESKTPGVFCFFAGSDAVRFVKQFAEYGLKGKVALTGAGFVLEEDVLPAQGESALGGISSLNYAYTLDNPENKAFIEAYIKKFKQEPNLYSVYGYDSARALVEAINQTKGDTKDKEKFVKALEVVKFESPRGPFSFDPVTHHNINNVYVRKVEMVDGKPHNVVIHNFGPIVDRAE
jgi:branched-chain amino acid transport system substrate-binding protein